MGAQNITYGLVLAGGRSTRAGGENKALLRLGGVPLIERVARRLSPQVDEVIVGAPDPLLPGAPTIPDLSMSPRGPLAGLLAALKWAEKNSGGDFAIATAAVDTPFFPEDFVTRLKAAGAPSVAWTGGDIHPTFGLWPGALAPQIFAYANGEPRPSLRGLSAHLGAADVNFKDEALFFNINTKQDLKQAEAML